MTEKTKELSKQEGQEVDTALVAEACNKITKIFSTRLEDAVKETGEYLIETFFDNDFEKAKKKDNIENSSKGATLNQVLDHFRKESLNKNDSEGPSKSWLYQAIDFVVQEKELEENLDKKTFQTYGKLLLSHKIQLLRVPDKYSGSKKGLILETNKNNLSVRELKEKINKEIGSRKRNPGILTIINNPELWMEEGGMLSLENLKEKQLSKLEKLPEKIKKKQKELNEKLSEYENMIKNNKQYLEKVQEFEKNIGDAIKFKKENQTKKSKKK